MNRLIHVTEGYRMAGIKVEVADPAAEHRVRLEAVDDPAQVIESAPLMPKADGAISFSIDTGLMEERAWRAVLVKTPSAEALEIIDATQSAMRGESEPPEYSATQVQAAGFPLETPLGVVRTRDPLEHVFSVAPAQALEHVRAFSQSRGWSEAEHEAFVQNLREMGLSTWREAITRELDERQTMLAMLEGVV